MVWPLTALKVLNDYAVRSVALAGRHLIARANRSESSLLEQLQINSGRGTLQAARDQLGLDLFIAERTTDNVFADSDFAIDFSVRRRLATSSCRRCILS
ncbi:MAG: hypothetical protein U0936_02750 [Planctomycetaceae bacterium]